MATSATVLSLFSGAGGLDEGLKSAGFEFIGHYDNDADACQTLARNGFKHVQCRDVRAEEVSSNFHSGVVDVVVGGPPCQPFSKSSQWSSNGAQGFDDHRSNTIEQFGEIVRALQPKLFLLENVPQFTKLGGIERLTKHVGPEYSIEHKQLNSKDFGVPQNRSRVFVVGSRKEVTFSFPRPTFSDDGKPSRTCWDYLSSVSVTEKARLKGKWTPLLPSIPPGKNYLFHTSRGGGLPLFGWRTRYWSFLYKLDPHGLSPTIVANPAQNNGPFHWENRELSLEEAAALQSFPSGFAFSGDWGSVRRQIGNAVPPLLGEHLGRALMRSLGRPVPPRVKLLRPKTKRSPTIPALSKVPERFLELVGEHPDHPGHGKGPRPRVVATEFTR